MKIGEYLVKNKYVTQEELNKALELQTSGKHQRIGEILVKTGAITKSDLHKYITDFLHDVVDAHLGDWLSQEEVDKLIAEQK